MVCVFPNTQTSRSISLSGQIHSISLLELVQRHFGSCQGIEHSSYDQLASGATCFQKSQFLTELFKLLAEKLSLLTVSYKSATENGEKYKQSHPFSAL